MMTTAERRNEIVRVMRFRKYDTAPNLAMEFNVHVCTIRRDITFLTVEGYFFDTVSGNGGGIVYTGQHKTEKTTLSYQHKKVLKELREYATKEQIVAINEILVNFS